MRDSQVLEEKVECVVSLWAYQGGDWQNVDGSRDALKAWRENAVKGVPSELRVNIGTRTYATTDHVRPIKDFVNECRNDAKLTYSEIVDSFKFSHEVPSPIMALFASNFKKNDSNKKS